MSAPAGTARSAKRFLPVLPSVALLLTFLAGPIAYSVYGSFTDMSLSGSAAASTSFVGLDNFIKAFTDPDFYHAVWLTVVFTVLSAIIGQNLLGMTLALLMRRASRPVRTVVGAVVIGAWVLPEVVAAYLWHAFLSPNGTLNSMLGGLGLDGQGWLLSAPILAVSLANAWRGTAFSMMIYSAALAEVPPELEEAATMDGAGPVQRFWHVTLPVIRGSVLTNLMIITLQTLAVFALIWVMTRGGPGTSSQTLPVYMYEQAFPQSDLAYGTVLALMLTLIGAAFSLLYLRMMRKDA